MAAYLEPEAPAHEPTSPSPWPRPLLWLALGLATGIALGLLIGWVMAPAEFTDANPAVLEGRYLRDYTRLIAAGYSQDGNLAAAQRRLASLGRGDGRQWLLNFLVDEVLQGGEESDIRQLARLAADLGLSSPAIAPYLSAEGQENSP